MVVQEPKKVITCDIDGILTDYPLCWLRYLQEKCGVLYRNTEEAKKSEYNYSMYKDMYRNSEYKANLPINQNNKCYLNKLADQYDIVFATSRPINDKRYPKLYENTYNWLKKNDLKFTELRFKDEDAEFLNGLDVAFHIDDEKKYATSIARKLREQRDYNKEFHNGKGMVFLLESDKDMEIADCNIIVVNSINEVSDSPFFSICIPATNREATIYRALKSISSQQYRNFELIITDCMSSDNTVSEILRFFDSDDYNKMPFRYKFEQYNYVPKGTEDWNEPIKLAKGKYIAMLEGDDYWLPDHLMNAYRAIIKNPNIGLFGSSNMDWHRPFDGLLKNKDAKKYCYMLKDGAVPPSESIFIRCNNSNQVFLYDSENYKYSPEIALYVDIVLDGRDVFYSQRQDVFREPSTNPDKGKTWYYFADRFIMLNKYRQNFAWITYIKAKIYNINDTLASGFYSKSIPKLIDLIKNLCVNDSCLLTILCIPIVFLKLVLYKIFNSIR